MLSIRIFEPKIHGVAWNKGRGGAVSKRGGFFLSRDIAFLFSFVFLMGGCNEICRGWIRVNRRFVKVRTMREECILIWLVEMEI